MTESTTEKIKEDPPSFRDEGILCPLPGCFRPPGHTGKCLDYLRDPLATVGTGEDPNVL